jgi:hypothetical protein
LGKQKKEISRETVLTFNNKVRDMLAPAKLKLFFDVMQEINQLAVREIADAERFKLELT